MVAAKMQKYSKLKAKTAATNSNCGKRLFLDTVTFTTRCRVKLPGNKQHFSCLNTKGVANLKTKNKYEAKLIYFLKSHFIAPNIMMMHFLHLFQLSALQVSPSSPS